MLSHRIPYHGSLAVISMPKPKSASVSLQNRHRYCVLGSQGRPFVPAHYAQRLQAATSSLYLQVKQGRHETVMSTYLTGAIAPGADVVLQFKLTLSWLLTGDEV